MANKDRGEVVLQAGSTTYKIRFTINSLCNLEDAMSLPITKIGEEIGSLKQVRLGVLRTILKYGIDPQPTLEQAGEIIGEAGLPAVLSAIAAAISQAFPEAKAAEQNPK